MRSIPLLIADGDIPTTHLFTRVLRAAHGSVETRYAETLFGTEVARPHVLFSRFCMPSHAWLPRYLAARDIGYLYLLDDNFWALTTDVDPHLAAFYEHPAVVETLDAFVRGARAAVVWSKRLGEAIQARHPRTRIEYLNPPFDTDKANALLKSAGGPAAIGDVLRIGYPTSRRPGVAPLLEPVVRHIAQRYPRRVAFEFVGWMPDGLADVPGVTLFPNIPDYDRYLEFKVSRRWVIGLAPLLGSAFDACKTSVKYREYGGCDIAGVYSRVAPYTDDVADGRTGLLVDNRVDAWVAALERLIESPDERRTIAASARADVERNFSQHASIRRWQEIATSHANH
jgi:glycosyltransferase involved in cell wall biosynthesis